MLGLLRIRIKRGIDLAIRDVNSSDPYVIVRRSKQLVYDHDTFTVDDKMGDAELDIRPFLEAAKMKLQDYPDGTVIRKVKPSSENCVAEESFIAWSKGKLTQDMFLRLKNVESGEIELSLTYVDIPGSMVA